MLDTWIHFSMIRCSTSGLASYDEGFCSKVRSQQLANMTCIQGDVRCPIPIPKKKPTPKKRMENETWKETPCDLGEGVAGVGEVESASP